MDIKSMTNYNYCIVTHTLIEFNYILLNINDKFINNSNNKINFKYNN